MIVAVPIAGVLVASVVLVSQLRTLEADRAAGDTTVATALGATATRVVYSILVVSAFVVLLLAWAVGELPATALAPFLTAPLAMRLGDIVSHRAGQALDGARREAVLFTVLFMTLLGLGLIFPLTVSFTGPAS